MSDVPLEPGEGSVAEMNVPKPAATDTIGLQLVYALGPGDVPTPIAVDSEGRILVSTMAGQGSAVDVVDREGRKLGEVVVTSMPALGGGGGGTTDVSTLAKQSTLLDLLTELTEKYDGDPIDLAPSTLGVLGKEATLQLLLTELGQKYEGGPIELATATLAALETINLNNPPPATDVSALAKETTLGTRATETTLSNVLAKLDAILTELGQKLETGQAITLDAATLAALETIQVGSFPAGEQGLAKNTTLTDGTQKTQVTGTAPVSNAVLMPAVLGFSTRGVTAGAVTLTLPAVVGQFHYVTSLSVDLYNSAARTGVAAALAVTTTNLPGNPTFTYPTAGAIGTVDRPPPLVPSEPIRSLAANTATTVVCPGTAGVIWTATVTYYTAP